MRNYFPFSTYFNDVRRACKDFHLKQKLEFIYNHRKALYKGIRTTKNKQIVEENPETQVGYTPTNETVL